MKGNFTPMRVGDSWLVVSLVSGRSVAELIYGSLGSLNGTPLKFGSFIEAAEWVEDYEAGRLHSTTGFITHNAYLGKPWKFFTAPLWPTVGAGRPGSMFGGLKREGTVTGRLNPPQPAFKALPRVADEPNEEAWLSGVPALAFK